jgi:hypothetical protein
VKQDAPNTLSKIFIRGSTLPARGTDGLFATVSRQDGGTLAYEDVFTVRPDTTIPDHIASLALLLVKQLLGHQ